MKIVRKKAIVAIFGLGLGFGLIFSLKSQESAPSAPSNEKVADVVEKDPEKKQEPPQESAPQPISASTTQDQNPSKDKPLQQSESAPKQDTSAKVPAAANTIAEGTSKTPQIVPATTTTTVPAEEEKNAAQTKPAPEVSIAASPATQENKAPQDTSNKPLEAKSKPEAKTTTTEQAAPESAQVTEVAQKEEDEDEGGELSEEQKGFRGNWEKKKGWLIKARNRDEKTGRIVTEFEKIRDPFQTAYFEIGNLMDIFWKEVGFNEEKFDLLFKSLEKYLEKLRLEKLGYIARKEEEGESLTVEESELKDKVQSEIDEFKKVYAIFKDDIKVIPSLKTGLEDRLKKLSEIIKDAMEAAYEGRKKYEEIWNVIDDQKAEALYIEVKNAWNKVKNFYDYIKEEFTINFNSSVDIIKAHLTKVRDSIKTLEEKGLIIKNRSERLEKIKKEQAEKLALERQRRMAQKAAIESIPWYEKYYNSTKEFFVNLYDEVLKLFGLGKTEVAIKPIAKK